MNPHLVQTADTSRSNVVELRPKAGDYYRSLIEARKTYCESNGHFYSRGTTHCKMCGSPLKTIKHTQPSNIIDLRRAIDTDPTPNKALVPVSAPKLKITGVPAAVSP